MTLAEIKAAVDAGRTVHWHNELYRVRSNVRGEYYVVCQVGNAMWALTHRDGVTMNGAESEFYLAGEK